MSHKGVCCIWVCSHSFTTITQTSQASGFMPKPIHPDDKQCLHSDGYLVTGGLMGKSDLCFIPSSRKRSNPQPRSWCPGCQSWCLHLLLSAVIVFTTVASGKDICQWNEEVLLLKQFQELSRWAHLVLVYRRKLQRDDSRGILQP